MNSWKRSWDSLGPCIYYSKFEGRIILPLDVDDGRLFYLGDAKGIKAIPHLESRRLPKLGSESQQSQMRKFILR